jgi:hypothetical protein
MTPGYRSFERDGEHLMLHLARPVWHVPGFRRGFHAPFLVWRGFIPGNRGQFAQGIALTERGAVRQGWSAYTIHITSRRRWEGE